MHQLRSLFTVFQAQVIVICVLFAAISLKLCYLAHCRFIEHNLAPCKIQCQSALHGDTLIVYFHNPEPADHAGAKKETVYRPALIIKIFLLCLKIFYRQQLPIKIPVSFKWKAF